MSLIKNLIVEPENKPKRTKKGKKSDDDDDEDDNKPRPIVKSATDLQRLRLEKLMKNPDKPIVIPESPREKDYMQTVPSFVRNVMGSSAGAGSGEFHVYRHLRRKEYARQKTIQAKSTREKLDDEYQQKLDNNRRKAEEKTAKKRAKRLKRKQRAKKPRGQNKESSEAADDEKGEETSEDDDDDEQEGVNATVEPKVVGVSSENTALNEVVTESNVREETVENIEQEANQTNQDDENEETTVDKIEELASQTNQDDANKKTIVGKIDNLAKVNEAPHTMENSPDQTNAEEITTTNDTQENNE